MSCVTEIRIEAPVRDVAIGSGIPVSFCKPKINNVYLKKTVQLHTYMEP